jgi:MinD-like ATPase involved in chromosome partitioning or flagellar assembly
MAKVISIHSSRGGTGKSVIATNLALTLSRAEFNVSLLDLDFRAPSLYYVFRRGIEEPVEFWMNDFFNGRCEIDQALLSLPERCNTGGEILIGVANPSIYAIRDMMGKGQMWEASALKKLYSVRSTLLEEMNMDYIIYDTSPGIQYSSINAVISSDLPIIVTTSDPLDLEGVRNMLSEFYDVFEKETLVLVNKAFPETETSGEEEVTHELRKTVNRPIIGIIPCYCEVLKAKRDYLLGLENPAHPFMKKLEEIAEEIVKH